MDERLQFVRDALSDRFTMSELCARYGVSRRIGYKWLARYDDGGTRGLADRSRAPHRCPHKIADAHGGAAVSAPRERIPSGARGSCSPCCAGRHPRDRRLAGAEYRRRSARAPRAGAASAGAGAPSRIPASCRPTTAAPNDLWTADFKGQFRTGDRPLLLSAHDRRSAHAAFCSRCRGAPLDADGHGAARVRARLSRVWAAARDSHGQRRAVRHASDSRAVVSQRVVDALGHRASADPPGLPARQRRTRADASHPQAPGDQAGARGPAPRSSGTSTRSAREYNTERPHERLSQETPASQYTRSRAPIPSASRRSSIRGTFW